ncbi:hypothetical protein ACFQE5_09805 [Pseudonocardia hispaniensis]|uniref:Uncharacterized protein n=1 Tax=Pseudonocardia hispaniensis TaxID=904933 RepID=A0ABW1J100_9PSEU
MQLPISIEALILLSAGVAAVIIAMVVLLTRRRRRRDDVAGEPTSEPTHADWTGETAAGLPDSDLWTPAAEPTHLVTVGEAVAVRQAATARPDRPHPMSGAPTTASSVPGASAGTGPSQPESNGTPERPGSGPDRPTDSAARPLAGSNAAMADAVTQAFAARTPATRPAATRESGGVPDTAGAEARVVAPRGDIRDRLLEVLLDDPSRAIDAAADLQKALGQLEKLTEAVRQEREVLTSMLRRLADAGLDADQVGRLSGLPVDDVRAMLGTSATRRP